MQDVALKFTTILVALMLGGCVDTTGQQIAVAAPDVAYACLPVGSAAAGNDITARRTVLVRSMQPHQLVLKIGSATNESLYSEGNGQDPIYANSDYAWKAGPDHSRLTDIANIQAYDCMRSDGPK